MLTSTPHLDRLYVFAGGSDSGFYVLTPSIPFSIISTSSTHSSKTSRYSLHYPADQTIPGINISQWPARSTRYLSFPTLTMFVSHHCSIKTPSANLIPRLSSLISRLKSWSYTIANSKPYHAGEKWNMRHQGTNCCVKQSPNIRHELE